VKVSAKAEYACLALIDLAQRRSDDKPVHLREIAQAQRIPQSTLTQVMLKLKAADIVHSTRGSEGGYRLARSPHEIKLDQILCAIDGQNGKQRQLYGASARSLASVWERIRQFESHVLEQTTIAHLATDLAPLSWVI
jgi:Rrf2 family transcriptional regulator, cysteine metabolism repressor